MKFILKLIICVNFAELKRKIHRNIVFFLYIHILLLLKSFITQPYKFNLIIFNATVFVHDVRYSFLFSFDIVSTRSLVMNVNFLFTFLFIYFLHFAGAQHHQMVVHWFSFIWHIQCSQFVFVKHFLVVSFYHLYMCILVWIIH